MALLKNNKVWSFFDIIKNKMQIWTLKVNITIIIVT